MGLVAPRHVGSSRTRARTSVPCIGRRILIHCATREVPIHYFLNGRKSGLIWGMDYGFERLNHMYLSSNLTFCSTSLLGNASMELQLWLNFPTQVPNSFGSHLLKMEHLLPSLAGAAGPHGSLRLFVLILSHGLLAAVQIHPPNPLQEMHEKSWIKGHENQINSFYIFPPFVSVQPVLFPLKPASSLKVSRIVVIHSLHCNPALWVCILH